MVTSDSGDESGGERRRITKAYYAPEGTVPRPAYSPPQPPSAPRSHQGRRRTGMGSVLAIASTAVAVIVVAVIVIVVRPPNGSGFVPNGATPGEDAQQITSAFLQAWHSGDLEKAAGLTDNPAAAQAALTAYQSDMNLQNLSGSVTSSSTATAPPAPRPAPTSGPAVSPALGKADYQIDALVSSPEGTTPAMSGKWSYHSSLTAYQSHSSNSWYIQWKPSVLAPNLTASEHVATSIVPPVVISVTDGGGGQLASYNDPGLSTISSLLQKKAPAGQGRPGLGVQVVNAKGKAVPNSQATVVSAQNIGQLSTTIDPKAEKAAKSGVSQHKNSAMVVIQPSTGHILAIANNAGQNDFALTAAVAPGSDMKIVTAAALFNNGIVSANTPVACPATYPVGGIVIHNDKNESEPAGTPFSMNFAKSCNNAFTQFWKPLASSSGMDKLASTAKQYFGLGEPWDIGISGQSAQYFQIPPNVPNSALAEETFGQATLQACPLAMASVAATVASGSFKQPVLVSGLKQIGASPLPANTKSQLWQVMRAVITQGTAQGQGFGPDVYAKTGTADVTAGTQPNAWFVAFAPDKDIAVADVVLNAGYGATNAGPEVKAVLDKY